MKPTRKRQLKIWACGISACTSLLCCTVYLALPDFSASLNDEMAKSGQVVLDRNGRVLRVLPDDRGRLGIWCSIDNVPQCLKHATVAAEDKRFYYHPGFDPLAIARAIHANIVRGKTVSGASTITQQVVRMLRPRPRTYTAKLIEILESLKMEIQLSKDQILELYLNLSPMGGNTRGAAPASKLYFGKDLQNINSAEAAVLAALPRCPSRYDPRKAPGRKLVLAEKDRILKRMRKLGFIGENELRGMLGRSVEIRSDAIGLEAPHFTDMVLQEDRRNSSRIHTTLDLELQHSVETILRSHRHRLAGFGIAQVGALVVSVDNAEVLAMVGSFGYRTRDLGYNNAVLARRSVGSALKPFLYAVALDEGHNSFSELPDTLRTYATPQGDYVPLNVDRRTYGPVTVRSALGNSLNISAVKTLQSLGIERFYEALKSVALIDDDSPPSGHYGLGLAVGNVETSLFNLVQAYLALANEGVFRRLVFIKDGQATASRVFSAEASYIVTDILADPSARLLTFGNPQYFNFGFPVSLKTGTSTNFRDNWIVAYTPRHVIGIWAGNFSGNPTRNAAGSDSCGPILKDVIDHIYKSARPGQFRKPDAVREVSVCWMSGKPASPRCPYTTRELFIGDPSSAEQCSLAHTPDQFIHLGGQYARWVFRRESEHISGRFRLGPGNSVLSPPRPRPIGSLIRNETAPLVKAARISIVRPHNLDRFVLSRHEDNRVRFRAEAEPLVPYVIWLMDGVEIARTEPPYEFLWPAVRGRHVVHALTPDNRASRIAIMVE